MGEVSDNDPTEFQSMHGLADPTESADPPMPQATDTATWLENQHSDAVDGHRDGESPLDATDRRLRAKRSLREIGFDSGFLDRPALPVLAAALRVIPELWDEPSMAHDGKWRDEVYARARAVLARAEKLRRESMEGGEA